MSVKINYVLACYFGSRMSEHKAFVEDREAMLRAHLDRLRVVPHKLSQITIVCNSDDPVHDLARLHDIAPHVIRNTPVHFYVRNNIGFSYGAYQFAWQQYGNFEYLILNEDDYVYTQPHFDELLVDRIRNGNPEIGFLCGAVNQESDRGFPKHASVYTGIVSAACLRHIANGFRVVEDPAYNGYRGAWETQIETSQQILRAGYALESWVPEWSTCFRITEGVCQWFGEIDVPSMVVPLQGLETLQYRVRFGPRGDSALGRIYGDGRFVRDT